MPPIERSDLKQTALLFAWNGENEFNEATFEYPVELDVRWIEADTQMRGPQGTPIDIAVTVIAAREIVLDSVMWLGTLDDWIGTGSNDTDSTLYQVVASAFTPDIKDRNVRMRYGLARYKGSL